MALPLSIPSNFNPYVPIPNNPFFSPLTNVLQSAAGPLVIGAGISINYATSTISATGGGSGSGTVTSIATGAGLTGGPITSSGTISLTTSTVTPGTYNYSTITVDAQGRLTAASSGTAPVTAVTGTAPIAVTAGTTPVVSIAAASTTGSGAVQLFNGVNSTSTTLALTAAQGKALQDQITGLLTTPNVDLAGTLDASTGFVDSVTSVGSTAGYTVGAVLPAADATTVNTYVVVTDPGTVTPPGGVATVASKGDWFLVSETSPGVYAWQFLNVGFDALAATTTVAGIVCLSTNALAQAGTDSTTALTPVAAASAYIPKTCITAKGDLITGTAASTPVALTVGTDGQALIACAACAEGLTWGNPGVQATPVDLGTVYACTTISQAALGFEAARCSTGAAGDSTAIGTCALWCSTTPLDATAIGARALLCLTTGCQNVAVGTASLASNVTGQGNSALGYFSLSGTTGGFNTALGYCAGNTVTTGICNVLIGSNSQPASPTDSCSLRIGFGATNYWLTGNSTKAIKPGAGIIDCANVCGTAGQVLMSNGSNAICWGAVPDATPTVAGIVLGCTTATNATLGCNSGRSFTTATQNTLIGAVAGCALTSGSANTAVGLAALASALTTCLNTAIGNAAGCSTTGGSNTYIGALAGCSMTVGSCNVIIGSCVNLVDASASCQLAIGFGAGCCWLLGFADRSIQPAAGIVDCSGSKGTADQILVSTGGNAVRWSSIALATPTVAGTVLGCTTVSNTALGCSALLSLGAGTLNVALGTCAGCAITTGSQNVAVGPNAAVASATGSCQLAIGFSATCNWLTGDSNKHIRPGAGVRDCCGCLGTNGQVLTSTGSALEWRNLPGCAVIRSSSSTSTYSAAFTPVTVCFGTALTDTTGWYNGATGVFQPNIAGYYQINAVARSYVTGSICSCETYIGVYCNGTNIATVGSYGQIQNNVGTLVCMNGTTDALCVRIQAGGTPAGCTVTQSVGSRFTALLVALA